MVHVVHTSHPDIVKRLKRAEGHLRKVIAMMEGGRSCTDVAQQLYAIEKAVGAAKQTLIHDHIDHCLEDSVTALSNGDRSAIDEFKQITKYL